MTFVSVDTGSSLGRPLATSDGANPTSFNRCRAMLFLESSSFFTACFPVTFVVKCTVGHNSGEAIVKFAAVK